MTQKAKGPAEGATSQPSQVQSRTKGFKNMEIHSTAELEAASLRRVNELSKQISSELSNIEGYHLVIIRPADKSSHPVSICLDKEFADMMQSVSELRKGASNDQPSR